MTLQRTRRCLHGIMIHLAGEQALLTVLSGNGTLVMAVGQFRVSPTPSREVRDSTGIAHGCWVAEPTIGDVCLYASVRSTSKGAATTVWEKIGRSAMMTLSLIMTRSID